MILLLGLIGAGKSLQGRMLAEDSGYTWISTGSLFRKNLSKVEKIKMKSGKLYSDEEVIKIVDRHLEGLDLNSEVVFDGFPRTRRQAEWLLSQVDEGRLKMTAIFYLKASRDVIAKRLHDRGRFDDSDEGIKARLNEYETKTVPMIDYLRQSGIKIIEINSNQEPHKVLADIKKHL